ncbi:hypothetical protein [Bradyrhizobium sp. SZCCHNR3015]|uniref:hypothetical protein n=1 Tax=Bradyrhizobium sp. SZCCHNR3015 TaxID=3057395 RepID=UPI0029162456|nr:hypothetical protein [Bradyrhizobium sp. SZCCHNR3015]
MAEAQIEQETSLALLSLIDDFEVAVRDAITISESRIGIDHTGRQNLALFVFAKLIAHCMSMGAILSHCRRVLQEAGLLDHFSLAALGRAALDASLMTMYISDPGLDRDRWDLRRRIFHLHELFNRKRFLTAAGAGAESVLKLPFFETYEERKAALRSRIEILAAQLGYTPVQIEGFLKGQLVFIDGARGAAREAGWDADAFDFHQAYLSNWVHSHPVSFLRFDDQGISFSRPSEYQLHFCGTVLEITMPYVRNVTGRMTAFTGSSQFDKVGHLD